MFSSRSNYCADDASGTESDSEIAEESKPKKESDCDMYVLFCCLTNLEFYSVVCNL
jgi:hypothetical protein